MLISISKAQCTDGTCDCHCTCCILCGFPFDNYCEFCEPGWGGAINNRCQRSKKNSLFYSKDFVTQYFTIDYNSFKLIVQ